MGKNILNPTGTAENRPLPLKSYGGIAIGVLLGERPDSMIVIVLQSVGDGSTSGLCSNSDPSTDDGNLNDESVAILTAGHRQSLQIMTTEKTMKTEHKTGSGRD